ncbi:hypothetical protein LXA43DRAFT_1061122 [Ganoderma leucocontextum]|nr:hypothetical protein LXA43DRAFT_1061122 [Ganoderma leucocontextum]
MSSFTPSMTRSPVGAHCHSPPSLALDLDSGHSGQVEEEIPHKWRRTMGWTSSYLVPIDHDEPARLNLPDDETGTVSRRNEIKEHMITDHKLREMLGFIQESTNARQRCSQEIHSSIKQWQARHLAEASRLLPATLTFLVDATSIEGSSANVRNVRIYQRQCRCLTGAVSDRMYEHGQKTRGRTQGYRLELQQRGANKRQLRWREPPHSRATTGWLPYDTLRHALSTDQSISLDLELDCRALSLCDTSCVCSFDIMNPHRVATETMALVRIATSSKRTAMYCISIRLDSIAAALRCALLGAAGTSGPQAKLQHHHLRSASRTTDVLFWHHGRGRIRDANGRGKVTALRRARIRVLLAVPPTTFPPGPPHTYLLLPSRRLCQLPGSPMSDIEATNFTLPGLVADGGQNIVVTRYRHHQLPNIPAGGARLSLLCVHAVPYYKESWLPMLECLFKLQSKTPDSRFTIIEA